MRKIRVNDKVIILTGKDKGKQGIVEKYFKDNYVIINNINVYKKTYKSNILKNEVGGIFNKIMPIHISNIAILNIIENKKDSVLFDNKKNRIYKSNKKKIKN